MPNPYTQYQNGATYYPFNLDYNIPVYGGGGGGSSYSFPSTPAGTDFIVTLNGNNPLLNDKVAFNVLGQQYNNGSTINIDSNQINDTLQISPITNVGIQSNNYFILRKTLVTKQVPVTENGIEVMQSVQVVGIIVEEYNNGSLVNSTPHTLPDTTTLIFDVTSTDVAIQPTIPALKQIQFNTNYSNQSVVDEVSIKVTDLDNKTTQNTTLTNLLSFNSNNVKIEVSGFNKFSFKSLKWQYADKFSQYSDLNYIECEFNSGTGTSHKRTLFNIKYLIDLFN